ncbi:hypothetical protein BHM03_00050100 [Ensete ventricosum]|uniref:Uncharacterized protein n=1 Tax=Ensete ventricosum TaxID=4639 RepID=A0A445MLM4_ENSVE|nr:hypothetical protein BHM03_00050100 [Ensete ventricosum]
MVADRDNSDDKVGVRLPWTEAKGHRCCGRRRRKMATVMIEEGQRCSLRMKGKRENNVVWLDCPEAEGGEGGALLEQRSPREITMVRDGSIVQARMLAMAKGGKGRTKVVMESRWECRGLLL